MEVALHSVGHAADARVAIVHSTADLDELWVSEANRLRADLPAEVQATLLRHEEAGTTDSPEYVEAEQVFYARHVCRVVPNPPEVTASFVATPGSTTKVPLSPDARMSPPVRVARSCTPDSALV